MAEKASRSLEKVQELERELVDLRSELDRVRSGIWGVRPVLFVVLLITVGSGMFLYQEWDRKRKGDESAPMAKKNREILLDLEKQLEALKADVKQSINDLDVRLSSESSAESEAADAAGLAAVEKTARDALRRANALGGSLDELKRFVKDTGARYREFSDRINTVDAATKTLESDIASVAATAESANSAATRSSEAIMEVLRKLDEAEKKIRELESALEKAGKQKPLRSARGGGLTLW